ncbi:hypothetical protein V8E54_012995 [Elaphomyces granulatus]
MLHSRLRPLPRHHHRPFTNIDNTSIASSNDSSNNDNGNDNGDDDTDAEDIFTSFLPHLFPDDAPSFHGDPGQHLLYHSPLYGPLEIMVPTYPIASTCQSDSRVEGIDESRKLFAHFLWSAAMVVAVGVEGAAAAAGKAVWSVDGHTVLELGAGTALPSIISILSSAAEVVISDHPSSPAFAGAIDFNIVANVPYSLRSRISAHPHEWGALGDAFSRQNRGRFTRIIAADCLWMKSQHENLVRTMLWFLTPNSTTSDGNVEGSFQIDGRVWIVAGFHTGRAVIASFFETAVQMGLEIEDIYERDLNAGEEAGEVRREWVPFREGEGLENRKRWCVVAVLRRVHEN